MTIRTMEQAIAYELVVELLAYDPIPDLLAKANKSRHQFAFPVQW